MIEEHKIKVLVAENSNHARTSVADILNADPRFLLVGMASTEQAIFQLMSRGRPDVVVVDISALEERAMEITRRIMESRPVPIVICGDASTQGNRGNPNTSTQFLEAGAVAFVEKPPSTFHKDFSIASAHLRQTIKLMSEVKVVHRWPRSRRDQDRFPVAQAISYPLAPAKIELIGIGASTGGPPVLKTILDGLPEEFSVPVLIVQHIARGFLDGLAQWLGRAGKLKVEIATQDEAPLPGHVYLAPDDFHMTIGAEGQIVLSDDKSDDGLRPSVSRLFHSLAEISGSSAIGVLLTGMGKDGAQGLKHMKDCGATTIVQDRKTSVIHGMPGEAIAIGAADCVMPADQIASALVALTKRQFITEGALP